VKGPNTFLGSGHPAPGGGDHANRGLIESTDSSRTWKTLSLGGEADFHALEYAHNTVYGYDSTNGLLRVSKDGKALDDRAELTALDIAVSPDDPTSYWPPHRRASRRAPTAAGRSAPEPNR
jgi:hypothetical protein